MSAAAGLLPGPVPAPVPPPTWPPPRTHAAPACHGPPSSRRTRPAGPGRTEPGGGEVQCQSAERGQGLAGLGPEQGQAGGLSLGSGQNRAGGRTGLGPGS